MSPLTDTNVVEFEWFGTSERDRQGQRPGTRLVCKLGTIARD
jgi:hypothetical protein